MARLRRFHREQDIYGQEERSDTWYRVVSGSARKYLIRADGCQTHLSGEVGKALGQNTGVLFDTPKIEEVDVVAEKQPI